MARLAKIQAVTFDAGGTLLEAWPSVGEIYADVADNHGWPGLDVARLNGQFAAAWRAKAGFDYSPGAWRWLVEQSFAGLVDPAGVREFFDDLYARFEQPNAWRVYDDVRPALARLQERGLRLAVVSNWDARLGPLLRRLGLAEFFDFIVISAEVGSAKPSPRIFSVAAARLGAAPAAMLHVGDAEDEDVSGARDAGLAAVRIDRGQSRETAAVIPRLTCLDSRV